jgi:hypothetical protein
LVQMRITPLGRQDHDQLDGSVQLPSLQDWATRNLHLSSHQDRNRNIVSVPKHDPREVLTYAALALMMVHICLRKYMYLALRCVCVYIYIYMKSDEVIHTMV